MHDTGPLPLLTSLFEDFLRLFFLRISPTMMRCRPSCAARSLLSSSGSGKAYRTFNPRIALIMKTLRHLDTRHNARHLHSHSGFHAWCIGGVPLIVSQRHQRAAADVLLDGLRCVIDASSAGSRCRRAGQLGALLSAQDPDPGFPA